jgi:hypothetical protein
MTSLKRKFLASEELTTDKKLKAVEEKDAKEEKKTELRVLSLLTRTSFPEILGTEKGDILVNVRGEVAVFHIESVGTCSVSGRLWRSDPLRSSSRIMACSELSNGWCLLDIGKQSWEDFEQKMSFLEIQKAFEDATESTWSDELHIYIPLEAKSFDFENIKWADIAQTSGTVEDALGRFTRAPFPGKLTLDLTDEKQAQRLPSLLQAGFRIVQCPEDGRGMKLQPSQFKCPGCSKVVETTSAVICENRRHDQRGRWIFDLHRSCSGCAPQCSGCGRHICSEHAVFREHEALQGKHGMCEWCAEIFDHFLVRVKKS